MWHIIKTDLPPPESGQMLCKSWLEPLLAWAEGRFPVS